MLNLTKLVVVAILVWLVWFNHACNSLLPRIAPIKKHKHKLHHTKGGFGAKDPSAPGRVYVIAGGSGFIGSWIARYLLTRNDRVYIFDTQRPSSDLLKYGAHWVDVDLTFAFGVTNELRQITRTVAHEDTQIIIYNCLVRKKYDLPNFRADLGVASTENLYISLSTIPLKRVFIIFVGDCLSHREPIKNEDRFFPTPEMWCQTSAPVSETTTRNTQYLTEKEKESRDRAFSSYAWHELQVERMTRTSSSRFAAIAGAAVLRVEGFVSGHVGDGLLTPILQQGYAVVHSENVPMSIVNVEDVARAALSLEYLLLDPKTRSATDQQSFVVGCPEVTNLREVFNYMRERRRKLKLVRIPPAVVFAATWLMSLVYTGKPRARRDRWDNMLRMTPSTLTFARFYTCQVGQVPNPANERHQKEVLNLHNNFTLSATLDGLLDDIEELERQDSLKGSGLAKAEHKEAHTEYDKRTSINAPPEVSAT